ISGGENITATGGVGLAGKGFGSSGGGNMTVTVKDGDVTANGGNYGGAGIGFGSGGGGNANITIEDGKVEANGNGGGAGIGGGNNSGGSLTVTIKDGDVTANGSISSIKNGEDFILYGGAGIGEGANSTMTDSSITINKGTVSAFGPNSEKEGNIGTGIGGSTVTIGIGTDKENYPWIYTNEIKNKNDTDTDDYKDKYHGIIFIGASKDEATEGIVYGAVLNDTNGEFRKENNVSKIIVLGGETYKIEEGEELILDGTILHLNAGATLDNWKRVKCINGGKIEHDDPSDYDSATGLCTICGSPGIHKWDTSYWEFDNSYHWHSCLETKDCSTKENLRTNCHLEENHIYNLMGGYGEHVADENNPDKVEEVTVEGVEKIKRTYICQTCGHTFYKLADKPKPAPDPDPEESTTTASTSAPTETTPTTTTPTETAPTTATPTETAPTETTPTGTTSPNTAGRPNIEGAPNRTTLPDSQAATVPNEPVGSEDISMGSGLFAGAVNAVRSDKFIAVPPIVISIGAAVSAFTSKRRRKK
ncbi:MAG: hypothetical protein K2N72_03715, partial [Oscillospiraceae bacterium]|nr:hypothetical protein [Oscillospiraceae bacterium]